MKLEWNQCNVGWTTQAGDTWATVESDKSGNWMWRIYAPCAKCYTAFGIVPAGPNALAAAKAAAEAALTPERDPLEPIAWALSLAGHRPGRNDFYLNKTAAEIDARNGYEVIPLVDGRKVATLLGKDQPEPKKQLVVKDREGVAQIYYDCPDLQPLIDATIDGVLDIFAAQFGVKTFDAGDGSEDFWGDIGGSVMNLLTEAGLNKYRGKDQPETPAPQPVQDDAAARKPLDRIPQVSHAINEPLAKAENNAELFEDASFFGALGSALRERDKDRDKRIADEARRELCDGIGADLAGSTVPWVDTKYASQLVERLRPWFASRDALKADLARSELRKQIADELRQLGGYSYIAAKIETGDIAKGDK